MEHERSNAPRSQPLAVFPLLKRLMKSSKRKSCSGGGILGGRTWVVVCGRACLYTHKYSRTKEPKRLPAIPP